MYVCFSNVNFINTMIIMKKIIMFVLSGLLFIGCYENETIHADYMEKQANGTDATATISPSRIARQPLSYLKKQPKEIRGSGVRRSSMLFQVWTKRYWKKGSTLFITM